MGRSKWLKLGFFLRSRRVMNLGGLPAQLKREEFRHQSLSYPQLWGGLVGGLLTTFRSFRPPSPGLRCGWAADQTVFLGVGKMPCAELSAVGKHRKRDKFWDGSEPAAQAAVPHRALLDRGYRDRKEKKK